MSFTPSAIPVGQQFNYSTTITTAESFLYYLLLVIITSRNFNNVANEICEAVAISNYLFALNDPNISAANQQQIINALNNICTPFNSQIYPILNL